MQWLEKADFEAKIVIAGNHDITLDKDFYSQHGRQFHNKESQDSSRCISLLSSPAVTYLCHSSATIRLGDTSDPGTEFTVFGSPYSPRVGLWAFGYDRPDATMGTPGTKLWDAIPPNTDILITHTPPYTHCDRGPLTDVSLGCEILQKTLWRVRPRLHICGHIHPGRGAERVRWGTDKPENTNTTRWEDPAPDSKSSKMSLVDLTARNGNQPLDFQRSARYELHAPGSHPIPDTASDPARGSPCCSPTPQPEESQPSDPDDRVSRDSSSGASSPSSATPAAGANLATDALGPAADEGWMGRGETCIVNCAIMATNWPHKGGKKLNKPIVVDLDLPVWR
ncbi:hypothetical protein B0T25DRAFT_114304 [Lasiosphaeria hispida]|uniref:Calcineurin-like phosphoesterase domain-containing protein n=1 Tax=Lasiosphaeria hispida TaxID=260671 RepID=A0AAJ0HR49_9PEZI|nr:hypothetical protein B0T25DRAFT_114304 [Lasiosphaeria hispida]